MPGESAEEMWKANESAFKSTKKHMEQGKDSTEDLIKMLGSLQRKAPDADEGQGKDSTEDLIKAPDADEGQGKDSTEDLISLQRKAADTDERKKERFLEYDGQKSWKIRAVSLIHFMLCYYSDTNSGVVETAFKACTEAWALMDFVESSDTEANLASLAADREFNTLENIWNKKLKVKRTQSNRKLTVRDRMIQSIESKLKIKPTQSDSKLTIRDTMIQDIKSRISKVKIHAEGENTQDSMEKMMAAANKSLKKTSTVIKSKAINLRSAKAIHNLGYLVASVIVDCLANELNNALTEKCRKWAVDGEEQKIYHAAFIAGKAMAVSVLSQTSEDNNACGGGVAPDDKENNSCGIPEAVDTVREDLEEAEDDAECGGDNEEAGDDAEFVGDSNC